MLFCFVTTATYSISFTPKSRECIFCVRMSILVQSRIENLSKLCHTSASCGVLVLLLLRLPELLVLGYQRLLFSKWYRR